MTSILIYLIWIILLFVKTDGGGRTKKWKIKNQNMLRCIWSISFDEEQLYTVSTSSSYDVPNKDTESSRTVIKPMEHKNSYYTKNLIIFKLIYSLI